MRIRFDRPISQRSVESVHTVLLSRLAWRNVLAEAMRSIRLACLTLLLTVAALPAFPDTIDFRHLPDVPGVGGEITGSEFADQGLQLTMLDGLSFNVGCGTIVSCLGADRATSKQSAQIHRLCIGIIKFEEIVVAAGGVGQPFIDA